MFGKVSARAFRRDHITRVLSCHTCVILSPVCYFITRVLSHHPCVISSPVCCLITRGLSYHPCVILPPVCYLITGVLSYHPCVILSPVCYLITSHHPCVISSPVCYFITRILHGKSQLLQSAPVRRRDPPLGRPPSQPLSTLLGLSETTMVVAAAGLGE